MTQPSDHNPNPITLFDIREGRLRAWDAETGEPISVPAVHTWARLRRMPRPGDRVTLHVPDRNTVFKPPAFPEKDAEGNFWYVCRECEDVKGYGKHCWSCGSSEHLVTTMPLPEKLADDEQDPYF